MEQTNSIGDMLGMDFDEVEWPHDFNFDEDDYDQHTRHERGIEFDILWDELDEYPVGIDDPVVEALLDDRDHRYLIEYEDQERETAVLGLALFAYLDDEATVTVKEVTNE